MAFCIQGGLLALHIIQAPAYNLQSCDKPSIKQIIIYYSFMVEKQYNQQELI